MSEQNKAAKDLASAIEAGQDTHIGTPTRAAKPGQPVRVTIGGNMGAIDAIAGTPLSPGEPAVVGFSESGEAIAASPSGSGLLEKETIIKEQSRPKPRDRQTPAPVQPKQDAICPILISETIKEELEEPPECACDVWKIYKAKNGAKIPYKGCAPDFDSPSHPDEDGANEDAGGSKIWGIYESIEPPTGGTGFPWASGASCSYPSPRQYGYELEFFLNQGLEGHTEHSLFGIAAGMQGESIPDSLGILQIFRELNIIIFPQQGFDIGVARIFSPDGKPSASIKRIGLLQGYRKQGDYFLEGRVASSNTQPPENFWWWRTDISYFFPQDFEPGSIYAELAPFKEQFAYEENEFGQPRIYYYCNLRRIFKQSNWAPVQDTSACPPPPELGGQPPGMPPGEEDPDGKYRYFMTRYGIAGITPEPLWLPFKCRADDPNFGQVSMAGNRIYVSIHRGGKENQTKQEKEQHLKNPEERLAVSNIPFSLYRPIAGGNARNSYIYSDDLTTSSGYTKQTYIGSWRIAQSLNHSISACEIWLYEIQVLLNDRGDIFLRVLSAKTYKPTNSIPNNPKNWKHSYMTTFLVSYCYEGSYTYRSMNSMYCRDTLFSNIQWQREVLQNFYADEVVFYFAWPNINIDFLYYQRSNYPELIAEHFISGDSERASKYYCFLNRLTFGSLNMITTAAKGLNSRILNLEKTHFQVLKRYNISAFDLRVSNTAFMPIFGYIPFEENYSQEQKNKFYKRQSPLWKGDQIRLSPFSAYNIASDIISDKLIERYHNDRSNLAANLVDNDLYIVHFEQVDHIEEGDSEEVKAQKRLEYQHELKYRLIKGEPGKKIKAKLKVLDCTTPLPDIENLAAPPEGVKIKEIDAQIYPLGWVEGETMGLTIWGAAPGPAPKPKK